MHITTTATPKIIKHSYSWRFTQTFISLVKKKIVQFHKNNFSSARYIYTYIDIAVALFFASLSLYLSLSISLYLCFSILLQQFDGIVWLELLKDGEKQEEKSSAY